MVNKNNVVKIDIVQQKIPCWRVCCRVAAGVLLAVRIAAIIANLCGYYLIMGIVGQRTIFFFLDSAVIILGILSINFKFKIWYWVCAIVSAVIFFIYGTNVFAYGGDRSYFYVKSPHEQNTLIVEEDSYMFSGWCKLYKQKNALLMKYTGTQIQIDDGYQSYKRISNRFVWIDENTVKISGYTEGQKIDKKEIIITLE